MNSVLFIDTSDRENQTIKLDGKTFKVEGDLVSFLAQTLEKEKTSFDQIKDIKIKKGPGSFTGLRMGAAVANALRYALGIEEDPRKVVLPRYGKSPNISKPGSDPAAGGTTTGKRKRVRG